MDIQFLEDIQITIQVLWILQVINVNVHKKKNSSIASYVLVLFNLILLFNIDGSFKISILLHIINMFSIFFIYKEDPKKAIVSLAGAYLAAQMFNFLRLHFVFVKIAEFIFVEKVSLVQDYYIINLIFFIMLVIASIKFSDYIKTTVRLISGNTISIISIIISSFFMDIIMANEFNRTMNINTVILINKIMLINIFLFILAAVYTTIKFDNKLNRMDELNNALEIKNSELRKIKHDYGAQISYLYGLFLLKRYDDIGKALKDIHTKNNEISSAVFIRQDESSIIYKALKPALDEGIHILLEENIKRSFIDINDDDLFFILTTIRNNALKYMDNEGIIIVKVYEAFGNAVIDIESSCVLKKRKKYIDMIKNSYFNLIEGKDDFYSLSGVKKIIEENDGEIYIKNKDISTSVRINIPTIINYN